MGITRCIQKFTNCLSDAWKELPQESKAVITKRLGLTSSKQHRMWTGSTTSTQSIKIHESIENLLPSWEADPSTFLYQCQTQPRFERNPLAQLYLYIAKLHENLTLDLVRLRFVLLAFYQLKRDFHKKTLHSGVLNELVQLIHQSGLVEDADDVIRENCAAWAAAGGRYDILVSELGGRGALLLLPDNISRNIWEREMPKQGDDHNKLVQSLKDRGICEEANATNAHAVADLIWTYLRGLTDRWIQPTGTVNTSKRKSAGQSNTPNKNERRTKRINTSNFTAQSHDQTSTPVDQTDGRMGELLFAIDLHANAGHQQDHALVLRETPSSPGSSLNENVDPSSNSQSELSPTSSHPPPTLSVSHHDCESESDTLDSGQDTGNNLNTTSSIGQQENDVHHNNPLLFASSGVVAFNSDSNLTPSNMYQNTLFVDDYSAIPSLTDKFPFDDIAAVDQQFAFSFNDDLAALLGMGHTSMS